MLKVLTLNINGPGEKHGTWERRKQLLQKILEACDADIVALQAVRQDPRVEEGLDQAAQLSALVQGYPFVVFQPATHHPDGAVDGTAFLSRSEPLATERLPLTRQPGHEDPFDRVLLIGRFAVPGGELHVANGHFSWVETQAEDNVRESLPVLSAIQGPALLVGDLNSVPQSRPMRALCRGGWMDAWDKLRGQDAGPTFEMGHLNVRIDYVWANARCQDRVMAIETVGNIEVYGTHPSDHLGLLATLDFPSPSAVR